MENDADPKFIFLISPVRNLDPNTEGRIASYVSALEAEGCVVHWPYRDTEQKDTSGFWICNENRNAIRDATEVHLWWSSNSEGSIFDMGMAFALRKTLVVANPSDLPPLTTQKSFRNVVEMWKVAQSIW